MGIFLLTVGWQKYLGTKEMENFLVKRFLPRGRFCPCLCWQMQQWEVVGISASFSTAAQLSPAQGEIYRVS